MDDVVEACSKHRNAVESLKRVAEGLKKKNDKLKNHNSELEEKVQVLHEDTDHSITIIRNFQHEKLQLCVKFRACKENLPGEKTKVKQISEDILEYEKKVCFFKMRG